MSNKIIIGIDPGTTTGIAVKDISSKQYLFIESMPILKASFNSNLVRLKRVVKICIISSLSKN